MCMGVSMVHAGVSRVHVGVSRVHAGVPKVHAGVPRVHAGVQGCMRVRQGSTSVFTVDILQYVLFLDYLFFSHLQRPACS